MTPFEKLDVIGQRLEAWYLLVADIGRHAKCLPGSKPEDNDHIVNKVAEMAQVLDHAEAAIRPYCDNTETHGLGPLRAAIRKVRNHEKL